MSRELLGRVSCQQLNKEDAARYTRDMNNILKGLGLVIKIMRPTTSINVVCPPVRAQCEHRHGNGPFKILIRGTNGREPLCFTMWDSAFNASREIVGEHAVNSYSVIKLLSDHYSEYYVNYKSVLDNGTLTDSNKSRSCFRGHLFFKRKIREWFTEAEMTTLRGAL